MFSQGYVGITSRSVEDRFKQHIYNAKIGSEYIVHKALNKYLEDVVVDTILIGTREYCLDVERKLRPNEYIGWNIASGGGSSLIVFGREASEETKLKLSKSLSKHWEDNKEAKDFIASVHKGRKRSLSTKQNISNGLKGKAFSDERKAKLSEAKTGTTMWKSNRADKAVWCNADSLYKFFIENPGVGVVLMAEHFQISKYSLVNIHKHFRQGWNPMEDSSWLDFKNNYLKV
jgi:hypothetical protein